MTMSHGARALVLSAFLVGSLVALPAPAQALGSWRAVATSVGAFNAVSCATAAFCVATGWSTGTDYSITYNGTTWSAAQQIDQYVGEVGSVSCPVSGWCAAVTDLVAVTFFRHGGWSKLMALDEGPGPPYPGTVAAISCTSPEFCVVVDGQGNAETFNGRVVKARAHRPRLPNQRSVLRSLRPVRGRGRRRPRSGLRREEMVSPPTG